MASHGMSQASIGGSSHSLVTVQVPVTSSLLHGHLGVVRIGELLKSMDIAACMSAERHSLCSSVTMSMDDVNFLDARANSGDLIVIRSRVNRAFKTSMEVGLRVEIETPETAQTRHLCSSYFVFVALDSQGKKAEVPPLIPVTDKEKVRWALAADRRQIRLDQAKIIAKVVMEKPSGLRYSLPSSNHRSNPRTSVAYFGETDDRRNEVTQMVLPQHANHYGNTFGGQVMCWAHEVAETAAARHARSSVVTVSVDDMFFLAPSKVGTRVVLKASVNRVFNRSMEVGVRVEGHHLNGEIVLINRAYFTMVAVEIPARSSILGTAFSMATAASPTTSPLMIGQVNPLEKKQSADETSNPIKKGSFFALKSKSKEQPQQPPPPTTTSAIPPLILPRTESKLQPIRSVPLNTPDQIRRHQEALGRRRIRLERLQLKKSNHLAWPFTPDTNPRAFALENLKSLERVALDEEDAPVAEEIPTSPTLRRGTWAMVAESDGVLVWSKSDQQHGISMKSRCEIEAPFESLIYSVWDPQARSKWDRIVVGCEIRHKFDYLDSDILWLAVDSRQMDPKAKPTDFALLRSWKRQGDTFCVASHSVVHQSVPANTNYVRAETGSSGFVLRDMGGGKTEVQYVVQLNQSGTSIVAGELVGLSRWYAKRMSLLGEFAKEMSPEMFTILMKESPIGRMLSDTSLGKPTSGSVITSSSDKNCAVM